MISGQEVPLKLYESVPDLASSSFLASRLFVADLDSTWRAIWDFQIASIRHQPLTVGVIVVAIVLLIAGYIVSRFLSRTFTRLLVARFHLEPGALYATQTLSFYCLFALFAFTSLAIVDFPLTAFGSQNLINNFISGLILNMERPVRVGDFVRIAENHGTIERIGARSTMIRTSNNTQMIVPNSFLLENPVVNYTLATTSCVPS